MRRQDLKNQLLLKNVLWFLLRFAIYTAFVVAYYFLVLLFLKDWLKQIFDAHKGVYALIVLPLIIAQAVLLDLVTMALRKVGWEKTK